MIQLELSRPKLVECIYGMTNAQDFTELESRAIAAEVADLYLERLAATVRAVEQRLMESKASSPCQPAR